MIFVFSTFLAFAIFVFKSYANVLDEHGLKIDLHCRSEKAEDKFDPISDSDINEETGWGESNLYPLQVCVTTYGTRVPCAKPEVSHLHVVMKIKTETIMESAYFHPENATNPYCHVFHSFVLAAKLKGKDIEGAKVRAKATVFGLPPTGAETTFQVSLRAASYIATKPGPINAVTRKGNHSVYSVVCTFPNCTVVAWPPLSASSTSRFKIEKGEAPQYVGEGGYPKDNMFTITSFTCPHSCPQKFIAVNRTALLKEPSFSTQTVEQPGPTTGQTTTQCDK